VPIIYGDVIKAQWCVENLIRGGPTWLAVFGRWPRLATFSCLWRYISSEEWPTALSTQ
jgi:hypothetical protein